MRRSHRGRLLPTAVGAFPLDESPYGIRDLAGSMQDWCNDAFVEAGPPAASARHGGHARAPSPAGSQAGTGADAAGSALRANRGGSWGFNKHCARAAWRHGSTPDWRINGLGLRLVRTYPWLVMP